MSISSLLFTSRDSLLAHQMAIDITGSNIANVDTPGYTRQRVDLKSVGNVNIGGNSGQVGVTVSRVERTYDRYIESQIVDQRQNKGYSDAMLLGLQNIEVALDDTDGGGINDQLNQFWASWENLSKNPGGQVERSALISAGESLSNSFVSYSQNLDTINTDLNRSIADVVSQVNDKCREISDWNTKIFGAGADTGEKNDLLDKRSAALKDLSELININSFENGDGVVNVSLSNGEPLVMGTSAVPLSVKINSSGLSDVYSSNHPGETVNDALTKGKLGAYIKIQNSVLPQYIQDIDNVAKALADRINMLHGSGFDAYQNTGTAFFEIQDTNRSAGTIRVNAVIIADTNRIAASSSVNGDAENASKIASVQNELLMNNQTASLNNFLASMVGRIGHQVASAGTDSDHQSIIMNQLDNQRESISGVSLDEEMIRLIKYQMGYTAAGKLCMTVNEMLDTLMGLVK
jgi:flagellar hook-associated protein 1